MIFPEELMLPPLNDIRPHYYTKEELNTEEGWARFQKELCDLYPGYETPVEIRNVLPKPE